MFKGKGSFKSFAPVNVGDEISVKIEGVGEKGDGIAKIKGFVIFVPGAKAGEEIKVKITKVLRKVGFGEVVGAASAEDIAASSSETSNSEASGSDEDNYEESTEDTSDESEE